MATKLEGLTRERMECLGWKETPEGWKLDSSFGPQDEGSILWQKDLAWAQDNQKETPLMATINELRHGARLLTYHGSEATYLASSRWQPDKRIQVWTASGAVTIWNIEDVASFQNIAGYEPMQEVTNG